MMKKQNKREEMVEEIFSEIEEELAGDEKKLSIAKECASIDKKLLTKQTLCINNQKTIIDTLKRTVQENEDASSLFVEFFNKGYYQPTKGIEKFETKFDKLIADLKSEISKCEDKVAKEFLKTQCSIVSNCMVALLDYRMKRVEIIMNNSEIESKLINAQSV